MFSIRTFDGKVFVEKNPKLVKFVTFIRNRRLLKKVFLSLRKFNINAYTCICFSDPKGTKENVDPSLTENDWEITCPEILEPVCHFKPEGKQLEYQSDKKLESVLH